MVTSRYFTRPDGFVSMGGGGVDKTVVYVACDTITRKGWSVFRGEPPREVKFNGPSDLDFCLDNVKEGSWVEISVSQAGSLRQHAKLHPPPWLLSAVQQIKSEIQAQAPALSDVPLTAAEAW